MAYYSELNEIISNVISEKILRNQNLCKLLYYYPTENTYSYSPLSQPNIVDTKSLLMEYIYPLPKMPTLETKQKCYLSVTLTGGQSYDASVGFRNIEIVFDIIVHLDAWMIKEGLRPYKIAEEIDKMFNYRQTDLPANNRPIDLGFKQRDYSNYYYGLQLIYQINTDSNVGCGNLPDVKDSGLEQRIVPSFLPKNLGLS